MKRQKVMVSTRWSDLVKGSLLLLAVMFCVIPGLAQDEIISQLRRELESSPRDTNKVWMYRDLAYYYQEKNLDSVLFFSEQGSKLAIQLNFPPGQIWSLYQKALALEYLNRFEEAMDVFYFMESLAQQSRDSLSLAKITNAIGVAFYYQGIQDQALMHFQKGLELSEKLNYQEGSSYALNNLAVIYRQQRNFRRAMEVHQKSLEIKEAKQDTMGMINSHYNLGLLHSYLNDHKNSLQEFQMAESLSQNTPNSHNLAEINIGLAVAQYNLGNDNAAYELLFEEIPKLKPDKIHEKAAALTYLGILEIKLNKNSGLEKLLQAQELLENSDRLELQRQLYKEFALAYELTEQTSLAVDSWKKFNKINDSINNEQKAWAIEEMQARFDAIEKDKKIQQQEMALFSERNKKRRIGIILSLAFFAFASGIIFYIYKWKKQVKSNEDELKNSIPSTHINFEKVNQKILSPLTKREMEIILLVEKGNSNHEIAEKLFVSENTVKTHLKNIFSKTEAINRTDLIHKLLRY